MSDTEKLVIQVIDGKAINHPLTYSNFLLLFPDCIEEDNPSNEVLERYGYNVFVHTSLPTYKSGKYIQKEDGAWTNTWVTTN
jgi:hypothetical protein